MPVHRAMAFGPSAIGQDLVGFCGQDAQQAIQSDAELASPIARLHSQCQDESPRSLVTGACRGGTVWTDCSGSEQRPCRPLQIAVREVLLALPLIRVRRRPYRGGHAAPLSGLGLRVLSLVPSAGTCSGFGALSPRLCFLRARKREWLGQRDRWVRLPRFKTGNPAAWMQELPLSNSASIVPPQRLIAYLAM